MPSQFIQPVPNSQAILLKASATLPTSSLYSDGALFSEVSTKSSETIEERRREQRKGWDREEKAVKRELETVLVDQDEAGWGGVDQLQCWKNISAREENQLLGLLLRWPEANH